MSNDYSFGIFNYCLLLYYNTLYGKFHYTEYYNSPNEEWIEESSSPWWLFIVFVVENDNSLDCVRTEKYLTKSWKRTAILFLVALIFHQIQNSFQYWIFKEVIGKYKIKIRKKEHLGTGL